MDRFFWKNVRTKRTKYPLTRARLGGSVRHKRPMRPNSPWSSWKGRKRIALRHGFAMVFSGYRPVSGHVVTSNCQRPAYLKRTHWAHPCLLRSHLLPLRLLW
jgi:hypothetical protein